ncbi:MAG: YjcZ-like family protein [Ectothiorhodospiraceae bacterium]|nr:YjcZ-like family protein [Ectothiorhodospiraceae bacterium]
MEELMNLESRVPRVSDKALINLINGIQVNYDLIRYQKQQGFFGKLFDRLAGTDVGRQNLLNGNLVGGQQALYDWVREFSDSLRVSQIALEITQNSLLEAREAIRRQTRNSIAHRQNLNSLDAKLGNLTHRITGRIEQLEDRVETIELKQAAQQEFDLIITAWQAGTTYRGLPWIIQVVMLVQEVFSSSVARYELRTQDKETYRDQLVNKILANSEMARANTDFFSLSDLLDSSWQEFQDSNDFELSLGILQTHTLPYSRKQRIPLTFTVGTTLELAALDEEIRSPKPGRCAVDICRTQVQCLDYTITISELIKQITYESADDSLFLIANDANI